MDVVVEVRTTLLQTHPRHSYYHTSITEQPELYHFVTRDIRDNGIRTPLLVQAETHVILDGHMRQQIALDLQMETVPVIYRQVDDTLAELSLVDENRKRQRDERNPIRLARQLKLLKKMYGLQNGQHAKSGEENRMTSEELARELGFKSRQFYKYQRLLHLTSEFQRLVSADVLGIKAAVAISYLSRDDQHVLYQFAMASGSPKNALSEVVVTEWITEYRKSKASPGADKKFQVDSRMMDAVDRTLDGVDQQYSSDQVVGTDKLLRQSILVMAEALPADAGSNFERAVVERNALKHIRALQRFEQRLMALMLPDSNPDPLLLNEIAGILERSKKKLDEVQAILNQESR